MEYRRLVPEGDFDFVFLSTSIPLPLDRSSWIGGCGSFATGLLTLPWTVAFLMSLVFIGEATGCSFEGSLSSLDVIEVDDDDKEEDEEPEELFVVGSNSVSMEGISRIEKSRWNPLGRASFRLVLSAAERRLVSGFDSIVNNDAGAFCWVELEVWRVRDRDRALVSSSRFRCLASLLTLLALSFAAIAAAVADADCVVLEDRFSWLLSFLRPRTRFRLDDDRMVFCSAATFSFTGCPLLSL